MSAAGAARWSPSGGRAWRRNRRPRRDVEEEGWGRRRRPPSRPLLLPGFAAPLAGHR